MCLIGVLMGVLKRVNGAVCTWGGGGGCGSGGLWLLSIDVFEAWCKEVGGYYGHKECHIVPVGMVALSRFTTASSPWP